MMKLLRFGVFSCLIATGVAIACNSTPLPLPSFPGQVEVNTMDMAKAVYAGYSTSPAFAAAMKKLDEAMSNLIGQANWHNNSFAGQFVYAASVLGVSSIHMVYIEKECDRDAIDRVTQDSEGGEGGGRVGGGGNSGGSYTGIVGFRPVIKTASVCTPAGCSSETFIEYEPIYGTITTKVV